jgi:hypothetical protein
MTENGLKGQYISARGTTTERSDALGKSSRTKIDRANNQIEKPGQLRSK